MSHTPGPWKWWTSNSWKRLKRDSEYAESVLTPSVAEDGHPILRVKEEDMPLIAAAPELYDALRCWPLNELLGLVEDSGDEKMWERARWFMEVRDFALRKAEGK